MAKRGKPPIRNARDCIKALGGPAFVAEGLGVDPSTVSGWCLRGEIGRGWRLHIYWSLRDRGFREADIPPQAFGVSSWKQLILPAPASRKRRPGGLTRMSTM